MTYTRIERLQKELERAITENDFELALVSISDMVELEPENDQFWNSKGVVLSKLERFDDAIEAFDTALRINPEIAKIWYSKGCVLMDHENLRQALACFYKALDLDPVYEKARERFIKCLDEMVLLKQSQPEEPEPSKEPSGMEGEEEEEGGEVGEDGEVTEKQREMEPEPHARKRNGSYLDDEMFDEGEGEEAWEVEEGEAAEEGSDFEDWGEEEAGFEYLKCRCGGDIPIKSKKRPYRFECPKCKRTGTLKA